MKTLFIAFIGLIFFVTPSFSQNQEKPSLSEVLINDFILSLKEQNDAALQKYYLNKENISEVTNSYCQETTQGYKDSSSTFLIGESQEFSQGLLQFFESCKDNSIMFGSLKVENHLDKEKLKLCQVSVTEHTLICKNQDTPINIRIVILQTKDKVFLIKAPKIRS